MDGQAVKLADRFFDPNQPTRVTVMADWAHPRGVPNCSLFKEHDPCSTKLPGDLPG